MKTFRREKLATREPCLRIIMTNYIIFEQMIEVFKTVKFIMTINLLLNLQFNL